MLWVSTRDKNPELYTVDADGKDEKRLTSELAYDLHPAWSPDGKQIAFASGRSGRQKIHVMNADGSASEEADRRRVPRRLAGVAAGRQADRVRVEPRRATTTSG